MSALRSKAKLAHTSAGPLFATRRYVAWRLPRNFCALRASRSERKNKQLRVIFWGGFNSWGMKILDFAQIWHTSTLRDPDPENQILGSSSNRNLLCHASFDFDLKMGHFRPKFQGQTTTRQRTRNEPQLFLVINPFSSFVTTKLVFLWRLC